MSIINISSNNSNECIDECIDLIKESISKKNIKYYEYKHFSNFQKIGFGAFGIVYRANWKTLEQSFALKSFFNFDHVTVKEIFREVIKKYFFFCLFNIWCHLCLKFMFIF